MMPSIKYSPVSLKEKMARVKARGALLTLQAQKHDVSERIRALRNQLKVTAPKARKGA